MRNTAVASPNGSIDQYRPGPCHLAPAESKSAAAFTESYGVFQRAALAHEPSYQVRGVLTDGFDSTVSSMRTLFPATRLGFCLRHASTNSRAN